MSSRPVGGEELSSLLGGQRQRSGWLAHCPAHDDKNPSLSINEKDGATLVFCLSQNCSQTAIIAALAAKHGVRPSSRQTDASASGEDIGDAIVPVPPEAVKEADPKLNGATAVYPYRNPAGELICYRKRIDHDDGRKDILPLTYRRFKNGREEWAFRELLPPLPLYNLHLLAASPDKPVLIVEGEKTADAAKERFPGRVVMTWPGGTPRAGDAHWLPLRDRDVTVWPDHDDPGRKAAARIIAELRKIGARSVRLVSLPESLPEKWDLAEPIPDGIDPEALLASAAEPAAAVLEPELAGFILSAPEMIRLDIPPRQFLVDPWLPLGALAMVYAPRGVGKTWFVMTLALALGRGKPFLKYAVPQPRRVLIIDGEMPMTDLKERLLALADTWPETAVFLPSEHLSRDQAPLNINSAADRDRIDQALAHLEREGRNPELIVFDNLSSLASGLDENDNSELDALLRWLIGLRHRRYTVLIVHHAGKSGDQRGASRREDLLDTTIKLEPVRGDHGPGARMVVSFSKTRGKKPIPAELELHLQSASNGKLEWTMSQGVKATAPLDALHMIATSRPKTQAALAVCLGITAAAVSKTCRALRERGLLGTGLSITVKGMRAIEEHWPGTADPQSSLI